ncbi:hypothetical protein [Halorubrum lacusprofundi]|jgi:hypothetical protein|uniref:hypothetical protein n=1 Tax=Halorubrum lacusprofundi TaxID=2247 RepID=UPI000B5A55D7|nr:hypothetical protein [Halorubrum lacusprofundi]
MNRRNSLIGSAGVLGASAVGSLAYTEATVQRNVDVRVEADDNAQAALRLQAGPAGGSEVDQTTGQLVVTGEADGVHVTPDGEFIFGDDADPANVYAFSMTNNLAVYREFAVTTATDKTDTAVGIDFYDSAGNLLGSSAGAETVSTDTTDVQVETVATVPTDTSISLTVYEDTDPASDTDEILSATRNVEDGTNVYSLTELDFSDESDVWMEVEFTVQDSATEDPELSEVTLQTSQGSDIGTIDDAGQIVPLDAGEVAYAVMSVTTPQSDGTVSGLVEIQSSETESFA